MEKLKLSSFTVLTVVLFTVGIYAIEINETMDTTAPVANPAYRAETGTQTGRISLNGVASACGSLKANPGSATTTGTRQYDEYGFVALNSGCVTVTLRNAGNILFSSVAYDLNGLDTADTSLNYLADAGGPPDTITPVRTFSFDVFAGQLFHIVIHELNPGGAPGQSYTLDVAGVKLVPDFSVSEVLDTTNPLLSPDVRVSGTGFQTGRITRTDPPSYCDSPKPNPGLWTTTGARRTDVYRFMPASSGCAIVTLRHTGADVAHVVVYDQNAFDSSDPSLNYLADSGFSAGNGQTSFSFIVTRGVQFDIAVHEVNPGAGVGDSYTLNISNVNLGPVVRINSRLDTTTPSASPDFATETGIQSGRLSRDSMAATCNTPKPNPGLASSSDARQYDVYTFTPVNFGCVEVTVRASASLFSVAYDQIGLNSADPSQNYLADPGSSGNTTYSFPVFAGQPFSVVVHEVNQGSGIGQDYSLEVKGVALSVTPRAAPFDLDGDDRADVGIFRPGPGEWWYLRSIDNVANAFQFGAGTDTITPADFTGDGLIDIAFFRPSTGFWFVLRSEDNSFFAFPFGTNGDIPIPGDYDGDGLADPAVFRPSSATFFVNNSAGGSTIRQFGLTGDVPLPADFDGDLKTDLAIFRPSLGEWFFERSSDGQVIGFQFGQSGDKPVPADFTGDGRADVAFFRPSSNQWFVLRSEDSSFFAFPFGATGDEPVPGDYDGDGTADPAVFRPSNNTWFLQQSTFGFRAVQFGIAADVPIPSAYIP